MAADDTSACPLFATRVAHRGRARGFRRNAHPFIALALGRRSRRRLRTATASIRHIDEREPRRRSGGPRRSERWVLALGRTPRPTLAAQLWNDRARGRLRGAPAVTPTATTRPHRPAPAPLPSAAAPCRRADTRGCPAYASRPRTRRRRRQPRGWTRPWPIQRTRWESKWVGDTLLDPAPMRNRRPRVAPPRHGRAFAGARQRGAGRDANPLGSRSERGRLHGMGEGGGGGHARVISNSLTHTCAHTPVYATLLLSRHPHPSRPPRLARPQDLRADAVIALAAGRTLT